MGQNSGLLSSLTDWNSTLAGYADSISTGVVMPVALTLLALVSFIGGRTLGGVVFLVLAFLVSPFGIPAIADWLMDRLYSLKCSLQDFITG